MLQAPTAPTSTTQSQGAQATAHLPGAANLYSFEAEGKAISGSVGDAHSALMHVKLRVLELAGLYMTRYEVARAALSNTMAARGRVGTIPWAVISNLAAKLKSKGEALAKARDESRHAFHG